MGRRILVQRRGKGTQNFRHPIHNRLGPVKHIPLLEKPEDVVEAVIEDFRHESGRNVPLAVLKFKSGDRKMWLPPEGMFVGDTIQFGEKTELKVGNTMALKNMPEGTLVYNIEIRPGDGGKLVRASGTYATVMTTTERGVLVILPSGKRVTFHQKSRATIGVVAAGGKVEKPFLRAGSKRCYTRVRCEIWPRSKACKMNAQSHPFGGGRKKRSGKATTTARNAPPGRKTGLIAARRTGLKKK
jgi:large subunit ribosomal protein L2